jgi:hypothetical protein
METIKIEGVEYPIKFCSHCMLGCGITPVERVGDPVGCTNYQIIQKELKAEYEKE